LYILQNIDGNIWEEGSGFEPHGCYPVAGFKVPCFTLKSIPSPKFNMAENKKGTAVTGTVPNALD
jgi:hypothetical protein